MKININITTGNWFPDGTLEVGRVIHADVSTKEDLDEAVAELGELSSFYITDDDGNRHDFTVLRYWFDHRPLDDGKHAGKIKVYLPATGRHITRTIWVKDGKYYIRYYGSLVRVRNVFGADHARAAVSDGWQTVDKY